MSIFFIATFNYRVTLQGIKYDGSRRNKTKNERWQTEKIKTNKTMNSNANRHTHIIVIPARVRCTVHVPLYITTCVWYFCYGPIWTHIVPNRIGMHYKSRQHSYSHSHSHELNIYNICIYFFIHWHQRIAGTKNWTKRYKKRDNGIPYLVRYGWQRDGEVMTNKET